MSDNDAGWTVVGDALLARIRDDYELDWFGIHGLPHWERVRENGRMLAERTGADLAVVECFAAVHDCRRLNDGRDPKHGSRAAEYVLRLPKSELDLSDDQIALLAEACRTHTHGKATDNATIATCWDADRLDLWRVGIRPDPRYLVTNAASDVEVIEWAVGRSTLRIG